MADAQHGLVTASELSALGIGARASERQVAGGMWTLVLPGVHLIHGGTPTPLQAEYAAMLYAGSPSRVTGVTALVRASIIAPGRQDVRPYEEAQAPVHVLIPAARRRRSAGYARIERTWRLPDDGPVIDGIRLTPPARAVADACRRMRRASDVDALVTQVVRRGVVSLEDLERELTDGQMRGSALLRDALAAAAAGAWSGPEAELLRLMSNRSWGKLLVNVRLTTADGRLVAIPDIWLDDAALAVEVDSVEHHAEGAAFQRTIRRNARYAAAGVAFLTVLPADIWGAPDRVLRDITAAAEAARRVRRPDVRVHPQNELAAHDRRWRWGT